MKNYVIQGYSHSGRSRIFLRLDTNGQTGKLEYWWVKELNQATLFSHPTVAKMNWNRYVNDRQPNIGHKDIDYDVMAISFSSVIPLNNYDKYTRPNPDETE